MTDIFSNKKRSEIMSSIRNKSTKPEVRLKKALFNMGFRYRINVKALPGSPDIVLPKYRVVIFVNGCFWHGHDSCTRAITPKSNKNFWKNKIAINKKRDSENILKLEQLGWNVISVWDCEMKNSKLFMEKLIEISQQIINAAVLKTDNILI